MDNSVINELVGKKAFEELERLTTGLSRSIDLIEKFNSRVAAAQGAVKAAKGFDEMAEAEKKAQAALEGAAKAKEAYVRAEKSYSSTLMTSIDNMEKGMDVLNEMSASRERLSRAVANEKAAMARLATDQKLLEKDYRRGGIAIDEYRKRLAELESERANAKAVLSDYQKQLNQLSKEETAIYGSYRQREQVLARLKNLYKEMTPTEQADPDIGGRTLSVIQALDREIKASSAALGEHQRNVGDYAITAKTLQGELLQLKNILAELYNQGKGSSQEAQEVRKRIDELAVSVNKVTKETKTLRSQTRVFDALLQGAQAAAAAFGAYKSTLTLIGIEGEAAEKVTQKLAAVIALITSLQQIQRLAVEKNALSWALLTTAQKLYNVIVGQTTGLVKGLRIALAGLLGASIIGGIIYLIANFGKLKDAISGTTAAQRLYKEVQEKASENIKEEGKRLSELSAKVAQSIEGTEARKDAVDEFNKTYGNYLDKLLTETATVEDLKKAYQELTPVLIEQATLRATNAKMDEIMGKRIDLALQEAEAMKKLEKAKLEYAKGAFSDKEPLYNTYNENIMGGFTYREPTKKGLARKKIDSARGEIAEFKRRMSELDGDIDQLGAVASEAAAKLSEMFKGTYSGSLEAAEATKLFADTGQKALDSLTKDIDDYIKKREEAFGKGLSSDKQGSGNVFEEQAKRIKERISLNALAAQMMEDANRRRLEQELQAEYERYRRGEIAYSQYQKNIQDIEKKSYQTSVEQQLSFLNFIVRQADLEYEVRVALQDKIDELKKKSRDEELKGERELQDKLKQLRQELYTFGVALLNGQFERRQRAVDEEIDQVDREKEKEIEAINASADSEEEKQRRIEAAEAQAAAKHEALERRKKQIARQQAIFQKALSAAQTIVNTAQAVTAALTVPPPAGQALAAVVAAIGAAQLATILATPIPSYEKGTDDHQGGPAIVGERRREAIITPDGKLFVTASKPRLVDLPKHTRVLPDAALAFRRLAAEASRMPRYESTAITVDLTDIKQGLSSLEKTIISNRAIQHVSIDSEGIVTISKNGAGKQKRINRKSHI